MCTGKAKGVGIFMKLIHCPQALGLLSWAHTELMLNEHFKQAGILHKTLCPPTSHLSELEPCDVLYTQAEFALEVLQLAQKTASVKILHRDSAHSVVRNRMFEEENKRLGISWEAMTPIQTQRGVTEYNLADYVVVLSNVVRDGFIAEGIPPEKVRTITPGIDTKRFHPGARPNDGIFRVRCAGILGPRKGTTYLLEAWHKLHLANAELVFTGHQRVVNNRWVLEAAFSKYQDDSVKVLPFLPRPQTDNLYHRCDLHVLPSLEEGLAAVTLESMASALPQVVTRATGVTDTWTEECGKVVPERDVDALAEAIQFYYDNREVGRRHGQVARKLVETYTWERFGNAVVAFVKSLC